MIKIDSYSFDNFFLSCKFFYTALLFTEEFFLGLPLPLLALGITLVLDFFRGPPLDILSSLLYNPSVTACATGVNGLLIVCISKSFFFCLPLTVYCASLSPPLYFLSRILLLILLLISVRVFFTFCGFGT